MERLPNHRCFCGRGFLRHSDFIDHQPQCPGDIALTNRVSEYPSSLGVRKCINRRWSDDSIPSPLHGHWQADISPDEPDNDCDDHQPRYQQNRTTKPDSHRVSEHPSSRVIRVNRRSSYDSIPSPLHGHWQADVSPDEPNNDCEDHQPRYQQNRTTKPDSHRVSEHPSSRVIRVNRRSSDDSIPSPLHGHWQADISPDEPDNDWDDHRQRNRTTEPDSHIVSFGSNNTGAQVGINHAPITYNNSYENHANRYHQSSGGQIFNGDITAGRDIHIGTINFQ